MRANKLLSSAVAAGVLLICTAQAGEQEWREVVYRCDSGQPVTVAFRENGKAVRVAVGEQRPAQLAARVAKSSYRYANDRYELRGGSEDGAISLRIGSARPMACISSDPAAARLAAVSMRRTSEG